MHYTLDVTKSEKVNSRTKRSKASQVLQTLGNLFSVLPFIWNDDLWDIYDLEYIVVEALARHA